MTLADFIDNLPFVLNAPNGISKVRDLILSLAFRGALVRPGDSDMPELLGVLAKTTPRPIPQNDHGENFPIYPIPSRWRWVTLDRLRRDLGQKRPTRDFTYIDVSSIDNARGAISPKLATIPANAAPSRARKVVERGTIIYSTVRPYLRNIAIVEKDYDPEPIASTAFAVLHPLEGVNARYIYLWLRSPTFVAYVESVQAGIAYPAISDRKFFSALAPLPPLEEQGRIVAKVDELMALCDKLEFDRREQEKRFRELSRTSHERLAAYPSLANLRVAFSFPASSEDLRQTISELAVRGRLEESTLNDKAVLEWLKGLSALNPKRNLDEGVGTSAEKFDEKLRERGWIEVNLDQVFEVVGGIQKTPHRAPRDNAYPYLGVRNVYRNRLDLSNVEKFQLEPGELERRKLLPDDLLIIEGNGSLSEVGRCAIWSGEIPNCVHQNHVIRCRPIDPNISRFVLLFLNSPSGMEIMKSLAITSSGLYSLSVGKIKRIRLRLPPIPEQHRIVARVDTLLAQADNLDRLYSRMKQTANTFAEAATTAITGISRQESQQVKSPRTETITRLQVAGQPTADNEAPLSALLAEQRSGLSAKDLWQRSGLPIDAFYQQLKIEMSRGWIVEPQPATVREVRED